METLFTYNPKWEDRKQQYKLDDLAFKSEKEIKSSSMVEELLPKLCTMSNKMNPHGEYLWQKYKNSAIWHSYPSQFLEKVLGLAMKKDPVTSGFDSEAMKNFLWYTVDGTKLDNAEAKVLTSLCKFGSCILKLDIPNNADLFNSTLKTKIIDACDVFDYAEDRLVWGSVEQEFDAEKKTYSDLLVIHVDALDVDGNYYEAAMKQAEYLKFNFKLPDPTLCLEFVYPQWTTGLTELPIVPICTTGIEWKWTNAYAQPIIDLSWHIFRCEADNNFALHQQSTAHLVIQGVDDKDINYPIGAGAVHVFTNDNVKEEYVAPPVAGISLQFEKLKDMNAKAQDMLLNLISSTNASGEALKLQIGDKTNSLVNLVVLVGDAIQRLSEKAAKILGANPDVIEFKPNIDFGVVDEPVAPETTSLNNQGEE